MMLVLTINSRVAKKKYNVANLVDGAVEWTTARVGSAGKLTFTIVKHGEIMVHEGDQVRFSAYGKSYFLGYVFKKEKKQEKITITCYDMLRYLKAKQSYNFKGKKLADVVHQIAQEFYLTVGDLADTGYVMPAKIYEEKTLLDIITDCIRVSTIATGKSYVLFDDIGRLSIKELAAMKSRYQLSGDDLVTNYTYTTSIDDSYNYVKLVKPNKKSGKGDAYVEQDSSKIKAWGKLQYYEKVDEDANEAQIKEKARNLLRYYAQTGRKLNLSAVGVDDIRAGSMVQVDIPNLGDISLKKTLLVNKCTHKWTSNSHTMELEMKVYNG